MRRYVLPLCLPIVLAMCGGCGKDYFARQILVQDVTRGKLQLALEGSSEKLLREHKIDMHRRLTMPPDSADRPPAEIDVWVIKARPQQEGVAAGARATVLLLHGLGDSKARFLNLGRALAKSGFDVVLPDLRAHGNSTGKYVTYGAWERYDVKIVIDELIADKAIHPRVYAFGVSLGGSTAIQYAALDEGRRVKGVIAVAPFKDAYSICRRKLAWIPKSTFEAALRRAGDGDLGNFNPEDASALKAVRVLVCPLLLIHGRLDTTVPYENSKALYEAARQPKKLITVGWAGHSTIFLGRESWFVQQIEDLHRVALKFEEKVEVGPATAPAPHTKPAEPPPLKPAIPKPSVPTMPAEPTTREGLPATRPAPPKTRPAGVPVTPPEKGPPATKPAPPPTEIELPPFEPRKKPTTRPVVRPPIEVEIPPAKPPEKKPQTQPTSRLPSVEIGVPPSAPTESKSETKAAAPTTQPAAAPATQPTTAPTTRPATLPARLRWRL